MASPERFTRDTAIAAGLLWAIGLALTALARHLHTTPAGGRNA